MKTTLVAILVLLLTTMSFAQVNNSNKMLVDKNVLTQEQIAQTQRSTTVETIGEYAGLGKEVGVAIREGMNATVDIAERAVNTTPGIFTMWVIGYKVIGQDLMRMAVGFIIWITMVLLVSISYFRTAIAHRQLVERTRNEEAKFPWQYWNKRWIVINDDETADSRKWGHFGVFAIMTIICALTAFAG